VLVQEEERGGGNGSCLVVVSVELSVTVFGHAFFYKLWSSKRPEPLFLQELFSFTCLDGTHDDVLFLRIHVANIGVFWHLW
jgi:hypothetical protein